MKVSVITVVYNGEKYIRQTVESVLGQTYGDVEYIIIDGGSIDSTVSIIQEYAGRLSYWVSEKDAGIYDAMNKGVAKATGYYVYFMNCGDYFVDNKVIERMGLNGAVVYGGVRFVTEGGGEVSVRKRRIKSYPHLLRRSIPHQGVFMLRESVKFDLRYKILADTDLILRDYKNQEYNYRDVVVSCNRVGGTSSDILRQTLERIVVVWRNAGLGEKVCYYPYLLAVVVYRLLMRIFFSKMSRAV